MEIKIFKILFNILTYIVLILSIVYFINKVESNLIKVNLIILGLVVIYLQSAYLFYYPIKEYYSLNYFKKLKWIGIIILPVLFAQSPFIIFLLKNSLIDSINIKSNFLINLIVNQICVASFEEVFFRGLIFNSILQLSKKPNLSTILSSLIFLIFHLNKIETDFAILQTTSLFLGGFFLATIFNHYKSIWPPLLFHFLHNFFIKNFNEIFLNIKIEYGFLNYWQFSLEIFIYLVLIYYYKFYKNEELLNREMNS